MAPKSKTPAETKPAEEPAAKKAKADEEEKAEETAKAEEKKFEEPDAPKDTRAALKETIAFESSEMTLNAIPTMQGKLLMALTEGGMAYLMAGARANVAQKAGRYMFEVKVVQSMMQYQGRGQPPRQLLRVGFSAGGSTLMLGDDDQSVCFDGDGSFIAEKKRQPGGSQFISERRGLVGTVVAIVLNLDEKSPNANTVTLFCGGKQMGDPKPIPETLKGKPLHPHVCYRNLSIHVNFGPTHMTDLPFKCRLLQGAAAADTVVVSSKEPKDGKYEVVLPVTFPDEGTFEWLDSWLEKNPKYVELSDRKIMDWARCSGMWSRNDRKGSNDKPTFNYGVPSLDDLSVRKLVGIVASVVPRNYVVMEVKSNLMADERKETLKRFSNPCFKKVAHVVMGEPDDEWKAKVQKKILKDKQSRADYEWKHKKAELDRKKQVAQRQKELAEEKKKKEAEQKEQEGKEKAKAEEEAADKAEKKEDGEDKPAEGKTEDAAEEKKEEAAAEETKAAEEEKKDESKDEAAADEEKKEEEEEEDMGTEPPTVELTEEEKKTFFVPSRWPDLAPHILNASYTNFTAPDKSEGFDDVRFEWAGEEKVKEYLKTWISNKKLNTRIEDLRPGTFFHEKNGAFVRIFKEWQDALRNLDPAKMPQKKDTDGEEEEDELDVSKVEDIMNIGDGVPLFVKFLAEDWALAQLRYELHMVTTCFKKDCNDPEITGVPLDHVSFYYYRYFGKTLSPAVFGMKEHTEIYTMLKDTVTTKDGLLVTQLDEATESFDIFLKLTESSRRERDRRIEAGDETARLKYDPSAARYDERSYTPAPPPPGRYGGGPVVPPSSGYGPRAAGSGYGGKDKGKGYGGKGKGKYGPGGPGGRPY